MNTNCTGANGDTLNSSACGPENVMSVVLTLPSSIIIDLSKYMAFSLQLNIILIYIY